MNTESINTQQAQSLAHDFLAIWQEGNTEGLKQSVLYNRIDLHAQAHTPTRETYGAAICHFVLARDGADQHPEIFAFTTHTTIPASDGTAQCQGSDGLQDLVCSLVKLSQAEFRIAAAIIHYFLSVQGQKA